MKKQDLEKLKKIVKILNGVNPTVVTNSILADIRAVKNKYNLKG